LKRLGLTTKQGDQLANTRSRSERIKLAKQFHKDKQDGTSFSMKMYAGLLALAGIIAVLVLSKSSPSSKSSPATKKKQKRVLERFSDDEINKITKIEMNKMNKRRMKTSEIYAAYRELLNQEIIDLWLKKENVTAVDYLSKDGVPFRPEKHYKQLIDIYNKNNNGANIKDIYNKNNNGANSVNKDSVRFLTIEDMRKLQIFISSNQDIITQELLKDTDTIIARMAEIGRTVNVVDINSSREASWMAISVVNSLLQKFINLIDTTYPTETDSPRNKKYKEKINNYLKTTTDNEQSKIDKLNKSIQQVQNTSKLAT